MKRTFFLGLSLILLIGFCNNVFAQTTTTVNTIELGQGTQTNSDDGFPAPYGSWNRSFREQYLIKADEIHALGGAAGLISAVDFHVQYLGTCLSMPNYRIRMKHTDQVALSNVFELGTYEVVFQHDDFLPVEGWNTHNFPTPFLWNGEDNLIIEVVTDQIQQMIYTENARCYYSSTPFASTLRYMADVGSGDIGTTGTTASNRTNMRLSLLMEESGSLSGTVTEDGLPLQNVSITIEDTEFSSITDSNGEYSLPLIPVGTHNVVASKYGYESVSHSVEIIAGEDTIQDFTMIGSPEFSISDAGWDFGDTTLNTHSDKTFTISNAGGSLLTINTFEIVGSDAFTISQIPTLPAMLRSEEQITLSVRFTPTDLGEHTASLMIIDDQNNRYTTIDRPGLGFIISSQNDNSSPQRALHAISLIGNGVHDFTIGDGLENRRIPIDFHYKTSIFQTVFTNDEMNALVGTINGIKLYTDFVANLENKHIKIWLASTTHSDLSDGWISSDEMSLVYDGLMDFPSGENIISIPFTNPFLFIEEQNLLMLVYRPMDVNYHSATNYFKCQSIGSSRSRNAFDDIFTLNPSFMDGGNLGGEFPKITFVVSPGGVGNIEGIIHGEDGFPLEGVSLSLGTQASATTNQYGEFSFTNILPDDYQLIISHYGYLTQILELSLEADDTIELDITLVEMPKVSILGTIIGSDTGSGIEGANLHFTGYSNYQATTNAMGEFMVDSIVYGFNSYDYILTAEGYTTQTGSIEIGSQNYNMGTITMEELIFAPTEVVASISLNCVSADISWNPPDPNSFEIIESFEGDSFPPTAWMQTITNTGEANIHGVRPTWSQFGTAEDVNPTDGNQQAGLAWVVEHQDEWLFTPGFTCPPNSYLSFDTHLQMGSTQGDHYYVKATNDGGVSWQILWDGASQAAGMNNYDTPIIIDLTQFGGQMIQISWHAHDGTHGNGLWYNWYIDNIYLGNSANRNQMALTTENNVAFGSKESPQKSRALLGYRVWRLMSGQEESEISWTLLNDIPITDTVFSDTDWLILDQGEYLWAVRAIYDAELSSLPAFSNTLIKVDSNGTISGFVRHSESNQGIAEATVSAGEYSITTTSNGFYSLSLPAGSYSVTASHEDFQSLTHEDVIVTPENNTTLNFTLEPVSNEDSVQITATALSANYPNPFNPETTISYDLKEPAQVRLDIFNLKGQLIKTLVNDAQTAGSYHIVFTAIDDKGGKLSSGIYFYRLKAGSYSKTRKMMLIE